MATIESDSTNVRVMERTRFDAAAAANAEDASIWRWFSALLEERRIRWRYMFDNWVVNVDRTHVATERSFDDAIRAAKIAAEELGLGSTAAPLSGGKRRDPITLFPRRHAKADDKGEQEQRRPTYRVGF
ncbi:hypothetical protein QZM46_08250 [Burkholderia vietnamiensis]|uniref:Uncharacterized protein n=1 Tax=Burkholderia vietnamiensis TaxID=60552 RepID=A0AAW7T2T7_BURVI|nr:hypothetical protein [Burkholderia vietnamiensis]MDN7551324.1 hypothetical protein [Burkholderia vietnamiensis]MDN7795138.1 hypothetical protein [Burkholderia vietnamiensis]MDN8045136.1 hypothetical protein [Burkholderia vietnamiensis]MDN8073725.1 hypothetical protein [Burkholderia vietnamiensis]